MPCDLPHLESVLSAAQMLLSAREARMLTTAEWDGLEHAVATALEPDPRDRQESFAVERGLLVCRVVPVPPGEPYRYRCPKVAFEAVVDAMVGAGPNGFLLDDLRAAANIPWSQVAVAFAFLRERGWVQPTGRDRQHAAATGFSFEDAMIEYHALAETG